MAASKPRIILLIIALIMGLIMIIIDILKRRGDIVSHVILEAFFTWLLIREAKK